MRHLAAYLMLVIGGKAAPSAGDIKGVLDAAGVASDDADIDRLLAAVADKVMNATRQPDNQTVAVSSAL